MSKAKDVTSAEFDGAIASGVVLTDFWAEWCGPCRMMGPILDELAEAHADTMTVAKINVDVESDLAQRFGISAIPALILFKDGEEVKRFVGVTSKEDIVRAVEEQIQ